MTKVQPKKWIKDAIKKPGALHEALGVPKGKKIPSGKMSMAMKSADPKIKKMATLARTLGKMRKG